MSPAYASTTQASAPSETLGRYQHTVFDQSKGAPGDIASLAQTSDGFLWIAGTKGLTRFDGVQFTAFKPLPGEQFVQAQLDLLFPAQGGGLWIANDGAGPTLLKKGHLLQFGTAQGYIGTSGKFVSDYQGTIWSLSGKAIMYFHQGSWHVVYHAPHPDDNFWSGAFDASGNLWVTEANQGLLVKRAGSTQFTRILDLGNDGAKVATGHSGRIYVQTAKHGFHIYRQQGATLLEVVAPIPFHVLSAVETLSGGLWLTLQSGSVYYSSPAALAFAEKRHTTLATELVPDVDGLPWPLLEDHDGNVWLGRQAALDRFSPTVFTNVLLPAKAHELSPSVGRSGGIWLGSENLGVMHLPSGASSWKGTTVPEFTLATYADPSDGSVWGANPMGVWQLTPGKSRLTAPFPQLSSLGAAYSLIRDHLGDLFVAMSELDHGLLEWDGKRWLNLLGRTNLIKVMAIDNRNHLWLGGREKNRLIELFEGVEHIWDERQNLRVGAVRSIFADGDRIWVGGDDGVQFLEGEHFTSLLTSDVNAFQNVTGLVRDGLGNLWVQNLDGVLRIPAADLRKVSIQSSYRVTYHFFGRADGLPGAPDADRTLPSLRLSEDGRIWIHTLEGLAWIDPAHMLKSVALPPVVVESVSTNEDNFAASAETVKLAPNQDSFRIGYTIPALTHPERVNFSYRLVGFSQWTDVGARREAVFTHVPPGHFLFEVRAFNSDDVSGVTSASLTLIRLPDWYQTWWFRTLVMLLIILLVWLAFVYRLRYERRLIANRVAARHAERERIARELHDTLLQGFQGLLMRVQVWVGDRDLSAARRSEMDRAIDQTQELLSQGRDRILSLRADDDAPRDLGIELREFCARFTTTHPIRIEVADTVPGVMLPNAIAGEVLAIAHEAIWNAVIHARGSAIEVELKRVEDAVQLTVRDDGCGIADGITGGGGRAGHWGLIGMRERAQRIGAVFSIVSNPAEGTRILLLVPNVPRSSHRMRFWQRDAHQ